MAPPGCRGLSPRGPGRRWARVASGDLRGCESPLSNLPLRRLEPVAVVARTARPAGFGAREAAAARVAGRAPAYARPHLEPGQRARSQRHVAREQLWPSVPAARARERRAQQPLPWLHDRVHLRCGHCWTRNTPLAGAAPPGSGHCRSARRPGARADVRRSRGRLPVRSRRTVHARARASLERGRALRRRAPRSQRRASEQPSLRQRGVVVCRPVARASAARPTSAG